RRDKGILEREVGGAGHSANQHVRLAIERDAHAVGSRVPAARRPRKMRWRTHPAVDSVRFCAFGTLESRAPSVVGRPMPPLPAMVICPFASTTRPPGTKSSAFT